MKQQPVHESEWDYLIVLDACRFDIFKENYSDFLEGNLSKVKSRGSATPEWLKNTFSGSRYNYNYISGNVFVNNSELRLNNGFYAGEKFTEIHEAWRSDWNHENSTVFPEDLTDYALENIDRSKKNIIHFIQPHRPFISYDDDEYQNVNAEELNGNEEAAGQYDNALHSSLAQFRLLWKPVFDVLPKDIKDGIRQALGISVDDYTEYKMLAEEVGMDQLRDFYTTDLRRALKHVARFCEEVDGKVVVTADHGESWGENGEWSHPIHSDNPVLVDVPWLEVNQ